MTQTQKTRRQALEEFVASHPEDAFARYGLAMECLKAGDADAASSHFRQLLAAHPDYVAGYFHYGQLLARSGRIGEAKSMLSAGVAAAQKAGDMHAVNEISAALADLG